MQLRIFIPDLARRFKPSPQISRVQIPAGSRLGKDERQELRRYLDCLCKSETQSCAILLRLPSQLRAKGQTQYKLDEDRIFK